MKKLFTLLIAFMLALSFNAMAQWNTYKSINPSVDKPVDQLDVIEIDLDRIIGYGRGSKTLKFTTPDGITKDITVIDQNPLIIELGDTYTNPGTYTLFIPKDTFEDMVARTKNGDITISYTIPLSHTVVPAGGVVNEISEISVIFSAETNWTGFDKETTGIFDSNGNNLINDPAKEFSRIYNERNRITFRPTNGTINEPGVYTFRIPAGAITTGQNSSTGAKNNNIEVVYTIEAEPLEMGADENVTPAVGSKVMDLSTITIPFAEPVITQGAASLITLGGQPVDAVTMSADGLTATITSSVEFEEEGEVTLSIPEGFFRKQNSASVNDPLSYSWNLVKASLAIEDFHIYKGYTQEITIDLTNGIDFSGFQADLTLPDGLEVVGGFTLNRGVEGNHVLQSNVLRSTSKTRLLCYPGEKVNGAMPNFTGNSGALVTFTVEASADFADGEIKVDGIVFSTANGESYMLQDVTAAVEAREYATEITFTNAPEAAFELGEVTPEEQKFTAAVNAGAYNQDIEWKVEQTEPVITFENGIIRAVGVGQATITATALGAAPNQTVAKSCTVKVVYTHATAITIEPTEVLFEVNDRQILTATLDKATNKAGEIVWTSSDSNVAEIVITDGVVEVVGVALGTAEITAQIKNGDEVVLENTIPVKVDATLVTEVKVEPNTLILETDQPFTFNAVVNADATNKKVRWTSSDPSKVSINEETGEVEALALTTEPVVITATAADGGGAKGTAQVTVVQSHATSIVIDLENAELEATGDERGQVKLTATVTPATNKTTIWTSSNKDVATVDANGLVTAIAVGEAEITATIEGTTISATCVVEVLPSYATQVTINYEGETKFETGADALIELTATVAPTYVTNNTVKWISSDNEIATVNENGVVTIGQKPGVVTITAKANGAAEGQEVTETINFEVVYTFATTIAIDQEPFTFKAKETQLLTATTDATTNKAILWTSSNTKVATVVNGLVTAVGVGEATITATIEGTEIADTLVVTVEATLGDVNNNGELDVFDINLLAAYILESDNLPENFVADAADYNGDGLVNVVDIIRLSNIVLTEEDTSAEANARMYRTRQYADSSNSLFIEDFTIVEGETKQIAIMLNNNAAFSAFQADIFLPEGLEIVEATLSDRKADHTLASAMRNNGSVRLLSYSLGVNAFAGSEGELVYLTVKATDNFVGDFQIEIDNIKFATVDFAEYYLEPTVADVTGYTGVEGVEDDEIVVKVVGNSIVAPEGAEVYDLNGLRVNAENLAKGIYIVKVGNQVVKVII